MTSKSVFDKLSVVLPYGRILMHRGQPQKGLPNRTLKILKRIVMGLPCLILLASGYQPNPGYPPVKQSKVFAEEQKQTKTIIAQSVPFQFQLPIPGYLSQGYSYYHQALDIASGLGMPVKPIAPGKVISAGYDFFGYGMKVEIDHGDGYKSLYAHLGRIYVKEGDEIPDGNHYIGDVGLTGRTTGPHTHLEVTKDGKAIDARSILPDIRVFAQESDFQPIGGKGLGEPELVEKNHEEVHEVGQEKINERKSSFLDENLIKMNKTKVADDFIPIELLP